MNRIINSYNTNKLRRCFLIVILFSFIIQTHAQKDRNKLQENKKKIEQEIQYSTKLLEETKKEKQTSLKTLTILKNKINKREELITNISDEITNINGDIQNTSQSVEKLSAELDALKKEYAKMIVAFYKNRNAYSRTMFIFSSENFNQAYQRIKFFKQYSTYRKTQVSLIIQKQNQLNQKKNELEDHKKAQSNLLRSEETEKQQLTREREEKNKTVQILQKTEKELLKTIRKKEAEAKKLQKDIERIIAEEIRKTEEARKKAEEERRKKAEAAVLKEKKKKKEIIKEITNVKEKIKEKEKEVVVVEPKPRKVYEISSTPEEEVISNNFASNRGHLPWPTEKGIISSTFGRKAHPELKNIVTENYGIDILTNRGANARAVFNGIVTSVITGPNGLKVVIIRHGDYLSVYSNLDQVFVKRGDKVTTKQKIGVIDTQTDDNKTELQFQIWKGTTKLNPADWISKGA